MIEKNKLCIIIPMKHCSQRVPGKNYRDFNGLPLFDVIINKIINVDYIDKIIIDTNSEYIKNLINAKNIDKILVYDRPEKLCAHEVSTNLLLMNVIEKQELDYDYYLMTHVTNPLISIETIKDMIEVFLKDKNKDYDSLFSVKKLQTRLYKFEKERVNALNHNINELIQTQDLEPLYEENSCFYIFDKETLFKKKHRIGYNPYMYIMDDIESFDIDTESDFLIAKTLDFNFKLKENNKKYVLITGANGGIGKELCKKFKTMNWNVYGVDKNSNTNNTYIDEFINLDLTEKGSINQIIDSIKNNGNRLDCIVNNAALQICKPSWELSEEDWDSTYALQAVVLSGDIDWLLGEEIIQKADRNLPNLPYASAVVENVVQIGKGLYNLIISPSSMNGEFVIPQQTTLDKVITSGDNQGDLITVDSTFGWKDNEGAVVINGEKIKYSSKSARQFNH